MYSKDVFFNMNRMDKHSRKKTKKPWPTKDAMAQIYEQNLWGGGDDDFYSGTGSHYPDLVDPYIEVVSSFLDSFDDLPVVCDLGCGDFNIGRQLANHAKKYIGVDIVEGLIERNREMFKKDKIEFFCLDLAEDKLPTGDCAILRNVLQHLSNAEIQSIVAKLYDFKYVILTEHLPEGDFIPNKDIISGQGIRLKMGSGVDLTAPPFSFQIAGDEEWLRIPSKEGKGVLVTTLYKKFE
jgi:hypothetical protein